MGALPINAENIRPNEINMAANVRRFIYRAFFENRGLFFSFEEAKKLDQSANAGVRWGPLPGLEKVGPKRVPSEKHSRNFHQPTDVQNGPRKIPEADINPSKGAGGSLGLLNYAGGYPSVFAGLKNAEATRYGILRPVFRFSQSATYKPFTPFLPRPIYAR
jgi:hypothetical protein